MLEVVAATVTFSAPGSPLIRARLSLADEDLAFLQRFSEAHGTSAGEFLARQARNLRQ